MAAILVCRVSVRSVPGERRLWRMVPFGQEGRVVGSRLEWAVVVQVVHEVAMTDFEVVLAPRVPMGRALRRVQCPYSKFRLKLHPA